MALDTFTLTGSFPRLDGQPPTKGSVLIEATSTIVDEVGQQIFAGALSVLLSNGSFSVTLPIPEPDVEIAYLVTPVLASGALPTMLVEPGAAGTTKDLSSQPIIATPPTEWQQFAADMQDLRDDVVAESATLVRKTDGVLFSSLQADGTDESAVFLAELAALYAAGGGTWILPAGAIRVDSRVTVPNDGAATPKNKSIHIRGAGAHFSGQGSPPAGGTTLDLRASDPYGKIFTNGLGLLSMSGITFTDTSGGNTPFVYTTLTTLHIDQCAFVGSKAGITCDQDAIVCGGTVDPLTLTPDHPNYGFQGYGTVISRNYFNRIRRGLYGRTWFNANVFRDNTFWQNCGSNLAGGAAIELDGNAGSAQYAVGNVIRDNLIEVINYPYGIKLTNATSNTISGNNMYDSTATTIAAVRCDVLASWNSITAGFRDATKPYLSEDASVLSRNTLFMMGQGENSVVPGGLRVHGSLKLGQANAAAEVVTLTPNSASLSLNVPLVAGASQNDFGLTTNYVRLNSSGTTEAWVDAKGSNADVNLNLRSQGTGIVRSRSAMKIDGNVGFYNTTPVSKPTVTGSRGGNAALASLLTALASQGLITDSSTA